MRRPGRPPARARVRFRVAGAFRVGGAVVTLALLVAGLAGCGSSGGADTPFTGATATLRAVALAYEPGELTLPAGTPLRIILENEDDGIAHNVRVFQGDQEFGKSPTVTGPDSTEVRFGPLPAARYQFTCDVHPDMIGTIIVTP